MVSHPDPTRDTRAWAETAATFYRRERPDAHFRTSSSTSVLFADAVAGLLAEHPAIDAVVEVGAGTGTLLTHLRRRRPDLRLTGIDLRDRPAGLDPDVGWAVDHWVDGAARRVCCGAPRLRGETPHTVVPESPGWRGGAAESVVTGLTGPTLVLACEFLDDLPLTVGVPGGGRAEAWSWLVRALRPTGGLALLVDYVAGADGGQQLLGYRDGQLVPPEMAVDRNLTAPVDLAAVASAGEAAGATTLARLRQTDALRRWLPTGHRTGHEPCGGPADDDPLAALVRRSERHALSAPAWLGDHWWLLQAVGASSPTLG